MKIEAGWTVDTILEFLQKHSPDIEDDNQGQIVIYTGLWQTPDGGLTTEPPEEF